MTERWLPVDGYEDIYEISDHGKIKNLSPRRGDGLLRGYVDRYGYLTVLLTQNKVSRRFKVHALVCSAFNGPKPDGFECRHLDGNKENNFYFNLEWGSRSDNSADKVRHGTHNGAKNLLVRSGEKHPGCKFSDEIIAAIRRDLRLGVKRKIIAVTYGISLSQIQNIHSGARSSARNTEDRK